MVSHSRCNLSDVNTCIALCALVLATLSVLDLSSNRLTNGGRNFTGLSSLALSLSVNSVLRSLNLCQNSLGDIGAESLSAGITRTSVLSHLNISKNGIGDRGKRALAAGIASALNLCSVVADAWSIDAETRSLDLSTLDVEKGKPFVRPLNCVLWTSFSDSSLVALLSSHTAVGRGFVLVGCCTPTPAMLPAASGGSRSRCGVESTGAQG
jgi:hypothetical protein